MDSRPSTTVAMPGVSQVAQAAEVTAYMTSKPDRWPGRAACWLVSAARRSRSWRLQSAETGRDKQQTQGQNLLHLLAIAGLPCIRVALLARLHIVSLSWLPKGLKACPASFI